MGASVTAQLTAEATNSALSAAERQAAAGVLAQISLLQPLLKQSSSSLSSLSGAASRTGVVVGMSAREAAAKAAEERMKETSSTGSTLISTTTTTTTTTTTHPTTITTTHPTAVMSSIDASIEVKAENFVQEDSIIDSVEVNNLEISSSDMHIDAPLNERSSDVSQLKEEDEDDKHSMVDIIDDEKNAVLSDSHKPALAVIEQSLETIKVAIIFGDENTQSAAKNTLSTLSKIVSNVVSNPSELKFRKLRTNTNAFKKTLASSPAALEMLIALGFEKGEDINNDEMTVNELGLSVFIAARDLIANIRAT
jgi:hypothetical protein